MVCMLGEVGTEQFTVETRVDGVLVRTQSVHDPFIRNTTLVGLSLWQRLVLLFRPRHILVEVKVDGTEGVQRAIMTLDPEKLAQDTKEILEQREASRRHIEANQNWYGAIGKGVKL